MKTDFVEIFQTIRANLQPYSANGFTASINSETIYELWSEKPFNTNGEKIEVCPFASIGIEENGVKFCLLSMSEETDFNKVIHPDLLSHSIDNGYCFSITKLDEKVLDHIINALSLNFANFKQKGWV